MGHRTIRHTITRNGIYYVRFRLPGNKYFRKSLETDSHTQAQLLMSFASPVIPLVQRGTIQPDHFGKRLSEYGNSPEKEPVSCLTDWHYSPSGSLFSFITPNIQAFHNRSSIEYLLLKSSTLRCVAPM